MRKAYHVTGLGERLPQTVLVSDDAEELIGARIICSEELRLIAEEINVHRIALPPSRMMRRADTTLTIRPAGTAGPLPQVERGSNPEYRSGPRRLGGFFSKSFFLPLRRRYLAAMIDPVVRGARPGATAVLGDSAAVRLCSYALVAAGRTVVDCGSVTDHKGVARSVHDRSIAVLVNERSPEIGAVLLVGNGAFEDDISALHDLYDAPPIFVGRVNVNGDLVIQACRSPETEKPLPRISVVLVSFNQADYLEASIKSVLEQNYPDLEFIIVDGDSTDGSKAIIERYQQHFAHAIIEPDRGQSDALNKGFRLSTGALMNWLCSDDMLMPGALANVARAFRLHEPDLVTGACLRLYDNNSKLNVFHRSALPLGRTVPLDPYDILKFMRSWQSGRYFFQPEVFFSRRIWETSGAYLKEHLYYCMDYDMWLRMALAGANVRALAAPIGCSRVHDLQKTRDDRIYLHQVKEIMQEYSELFEGLIDAENGGGLGSI